MSAADITRVEEGGSRGEVAEARMSLAKRLVLVFACPGEVFQDVADSAPAIATWLVPTLLMAVVSLLVLGPSSNPEVSADWRRVSVVTVLLSAFAGTFWSALVLWGMGRVVLRRRFSYWKALEVVGLASAIMVLGSVETALLVKACGDASARPALSLLARNLGTGHPVRLILDQCNLFYLWSTVVLAIGLARVSGVSFRQAGSWVFSYWVLARMAGVFLGGG